MEIIAKLTVITATSLSARNPPSTNSSSLAGRCTEDWCGVLEDLVGVREVLTPLGLAAAAWFVASCPVVALRSRSRVAGMRCCLWALVQLWLHLLVVYGAFYARGQKVQAYVWALHASTNVLSCWRPKGRVLNYPGLQRLATVLGVGAVSGFAWQAGVPSGIAPWYQGRYGCQGQCGYRVHLVASLGVDLVRWALGPLGGVVIGKTV